VKRIVTPINATQLGPQSRKQRWDLECVHPPMAHKRRSALASGWRSLWVLERAFCAIRGQQATPSADLGTSIDKDSEANHESDPEAHASWRPLAPNVES